MNECMYCMYILGRMRVLTCVNMCKYLIHVCVYGWAKSDEVGGRGGGCAGKNNAS